MSAYHYRGVTTIDRVICPGSKGLFRGLACVSILLIRSYEYYNVRDLTCQNAKEKCIKIK